jgi:NO-binding membrane sensor protein with MHYT domain
MTPFILSVIIGVVIGLLAFVLIETLRDRWRRKKRGW